MESHVHRQEMTERAPCDLADRALGNGRKDCVSEFGEEGRADTGGAVWVEVSVGTGEGED